MFPEIHDSLLVAYSVNSESGKLSLSCQPHHGCGKALFIIEFQGVAAHSFEAPMLPAILYDLVQVPATDILRGEWAAMELGYKQCGWPGPWADTLGNAISFAKTSHLHGYQIESSYGLSGWILAQSVELASGL